MEQIPFPDKKYQIIYADPPWSYKVWSEDKKAAQGCAKRYYQTMTIDAICALPISEMADNDCKLFLWATPPCLPEAFKVITAWGFEYKTLANQSKGGGHPTEKPLALMNWCISLLALSTAVVLLQILEWGNVIK